MTKKKKREIYNIKFSESVVAFSLFNTIKVKIDLKSRYGNAHEKSLIKSKDNNETNKQFTLLSYSTNTKWTHKENGSYFDKTELQEIKVTSTWRRESLVIWVPCRSSVDSWVHILNNAEGRDLSPLFLRIRTCYISWAFSAYYIHNSCREHKRRVSLQPKSLKA